MGTFATGGGGDLESPCIDVSVGYCIESLHVLKYRASTYRNENSIDRNIEGRYIRYRISKVDISDLSLIHI